MKNKKVIIMFAVVISLLWSITACAAEEQTPAVREPYADALSYVMDLTLDTAEHTLTEIVSMEIQNLSDAPMAELCLRDMTPAFMDFCEVYYGEENTDLETAIEAITLTDSGEKLDYTYGDNQSIIFVQLGDKAIAPGGTISITVEMKTDIPNRGDRFGYRQTDKGTLYALSFCFPYLADSENGQWELDPFFDDGESRSHDLADYTVTFRAPAEYLVAMTGSEVTEDGVTVGTAESVRDFAIVACDFMEKDTFEVDGIRVNNYYLNGDFTEEYRAITEQTAKDSLSIFNEQVGRYPYEELDIVPTLFGYAYGGMEYPGLVMANASSFFEGDFFDAVSMEAKVSHEIAHQWFYAVVGNREYREGWLDEGFATLLERDTYGLTPCDAHDVVGQLDEFFITVEEKEETRAYYLEVARKDYRKVFLNVAPDAYPKDQSYGTAEYDGGYTFLQEVRVQMGDEAFNAFVRDYYEAFYMKSVTTGEFLEFLRTYDNSREMNKIIKFYFK